MNRAHLNRRQFCLALSAIAPATARAAQALRVLAWPGYADPDIVKTFEQRTRSRAEVTIVDSDVDLWQKISRNGAQDFDVFAVNTAELQRYIRQGLVVGIATPSMPHLARQLPRFRDLAAIPGLVHGGTAYAIPYTYAEMGLIYDRQQVGRAPDSIAALWDERYRGKVVAYNGGTHNFSLAAQLLGLKSPFRLDDESWPRAVDRLIALRRNAAGFYTQPDESVALFKRRHAALLFANYGTQQLQAIKAAGIDAGYAIPREGALAWLDCWAITRGARDPALATAWIDYLLESEPGQVLVTRQGLANTTSASTDYQAGANLTWLEPVESEERRNLLWGRIMSGDRASKVLAP
ncbi:extracellular solute-binding protein [Methylibium sp.]|uniref:extracellular solute-binding protein n=1 Tax=Methylibium sp. TaxID=2067992 RepID=UPI003D0B0213